MMNIVYTKKFKKMFKALPKIVQQRAVQKESIFQRYPFTESLKAHKLKGGFDGYNSFSVSHHYRIVFRYVDKNTILFVAIGTHSIYK